MRVASYDRIKMRKSKVRTGQPALAFFIGGEQMPYRKVGYAEQIWYMLRWKLKEVLRMPRFPDHPCRHPGCPKLVPKGKKLVNLPVVSGSLEKIKRVQLSLSLKVLKLTVS